MNDPDKTAGENMLERIRNIINKNTVISIEKLCALMKYAILIPIKINTEAVSSSPVIKLMKLAFITSNQSFPTKNRTSPCIRMKSKFTWGCERVKLPK